MDHHEYSKTLDELREITPDNLVALGQWSRTRALPWLWTIMADVILPLKKQHPKAKKPPSPGKLSPMGPAEAIRCGLRASLADRIKKEKLRSFYHAQLTMLDGEATLYCDAIDGLASAKAEGIPVVAEENAVDSFHRALHDMMGQAKVLLEDASREIGNNPGRFVAWRRTVEDPFEVFMGAKQYIYGAHSGLAFADRVPYTPVAVMRTVIELRMRSAFCVSSYEDLDKPDRLIPIDMNRLFKAIHPQQSAIEFAVDVHDVQKIYSWSNFYLHAGVRDYPWVVGFVHAYLHPLFVGSPSMLGGIRMKRETWHAVRAGLLPEAKALSFSQRLAAAWQVLWSQRKTALHLPYAEERHARCVFLD